MSLVVLTLEKITMDGVTSVDVSGNIKVGPILTSTVQVDGEPVEALLDSPVTYFIGITSTIVGQELPKRAEP